MRICAITRDSSACNYYRVMMPLHKLDEQGLAEVHFIEEKNIGSSQAVEIALWADIIMFHRPATEAWFNFIKTCRKHGKIVVSDYDDDPFNTSPLNPFYQHIGTEEVEWVWPDGSKEMLWSEDMVSARGNKIFNIEQNINHRDMFRLNFKKSDMVTCTTPELREAFLKINPNTVVLPNLIDPDFFPSGQEYVKKEIRIGWQGGASHYEDLYMVKDAIVEALKQNESAKFVYFGDMRFCGLFKEVPAKQIEFHSWISHSTYPYKLATLNLDIGLCPVVDNPFNRNKSAIKWMEYSMNSMATIASNIPPYSQVITNNMDGLLVKEDSKAWVDAINYLVRQRGPRQMMARLSKEEVLKNHNINTKAHLWHDAYQNLMKPSEVAV